LFCADWIYGLEVEMRRSFSIPRALYAVLAMALPTIALAQANSSPAASPRESIQDLIAHLTPQQKQQFDEATKAYRGHQYANSLAIFQQMLKDVPGDPILLKFASESALNSGEDSFALSALKPIAAADPDDWQAAAMLTRACAETGDKACRDAGMAHMLDLRSRGITPPAMQEYAVESVKAGANTLAINTSLVPWGYYKVYAYGKVTDGDGKLFLSISLESNDFDQPGFAKEHPAEAAKGIRQFSLDAYRETGLNSDGKRTQTHFTYKFFAGQPSYETIREEFLKIVNGQSNPVSSRSGLVVQ
jgi:hypothetical protein